MKRQNLESRATIDSREVSSNNVSMAIAVLDQGHSWKKIAGLYAFLGTYSENDLQVVLGRSTGRNYHILVLPIPSGIHIPCKRSDVYLELEPTYIYSGKSKRVAQRYSELKSKKLDIASVL